MGILSDLVSQTFGDTSDIENQTTAMPDFQSGTTAMVNKLLPSPGKTPSSGTSSQSQGPDISKIIGQFMPGQSGVADGSSNLIPSTGVNPTDLATAGGLGAMSDFKSKQNIKSANDRLDHILNNVYLRLKGKKNV
jgi:hypothetical protein